MKTCPACGMVFPDESTFCFLSGDTLVPESDPLIGTSLDGRFRLEQLVAETAWSKLYRARHRLLTEPCTVKLLKEVHTEEQRGRFAEAVVKARRCTHPNVAELCGGAVTVEGHAYIVHPPLEAQPLTAVLAKGPLPLTRALGVAAQALAALSRVHDFGGVHGSLRPSNILLTPAHHVLLIDVGLGRSLVRDPWEADPHSFIAQQFLAPELSSGQRASAEADLFALGATMLQVLSGALPSEADDVKELRLELGEPPDVAGRVPSLPPPLVAWLERLLARVPAERPANAHQALVELREACEAAGVALDADPGPPAPPGPPSLDRAFERWQRFGELFTKMVDIGFPNGAPDQMRNTLGMIVGRVEQLQEIGKKALYEHGTLADVLVRAREGRDNIARQMDELNAGAKDVRKQAQPLLAAAAKHGQEAAHFPALLQEKHREVVRWEGRSGFVEPYPELAAAYRELADLIDRWHAIRSAQLSCEDDAEKTEDQLREVEAQLDELREALRVHESNLAAEVEACEHALSALGKEADRLELELLDLASRFSAPLRSKPELGACFRELTQVA